MTLRELLKKTDWTQRGLADAVGCDQAFVSRLVHWRVSRARCTLGLALQIEDATDGEVTADELPLSERDRAQLSRIRQEQSGGRRR